MKIRKYIFRLHIYYNSLLRICQDIKEKGLSQIERFCGSLRSWMNYWKLRLQQCATNRRVGFSTLFHYSLHFWLFIDQYVKGKTKPVYLKHKDGFRFKIDCIIENNGKTLICVFPHSFDEKITKEQLEHYINVSSSYGSLCSEVSLVVFSVNCFSDWCVHQASVLEQLFCVTLERLKY